ncbi:MAG: lamin tail domain-containing protein [Akkermansiaceae bacterium]
MVTHHIITRLVLAGILTAPSLAQTLRIDFDDSGITQGGWQSLDRNDNDLGDSWSKNFPGGISLDVDAIGSITLDDRDRGNNNGGGAEGSMWRDFLFANGSFSNNPGSGLRLYFNGLQANTEYPVKIWGYDVSSTGGRAADWSGSGSSTQRLTFTSQPSNLNDNFITLNVTSDGTGAVTINGIVSSTNPSGSHNVFINGLEIGDPVQTDGPTALALSSSVVAKTEAIGTTVGTLTTTDPTPGDTFTYTLVAGAGDTNNALFEITGNTLRTDRDLSTLQTGAVLTLRVRTTDALGAFYEGNLLLEVVNDTDNDGLDDDWELLYFPTLTSASSTDDGDNDNLSNLEEQAEGTDPTDNDSDDDTLTDGEEVNTYSTSPLRPDTDGDGLTDLQEVTGSTGFFTNPNEQDSDGDGFNDSLEITENTDPNNINDFPNTLLPLRLNEILTRNDTGIDDGFGNREDWIEIFNPNSVAVNLDPYHLTDRSDQPTKWSFPSVLIPAQGYLIVFASGADTVDPEGNPHTNFRLGSNGEYLAIVRPDGTTVDDSFAPTYPEQFTDISYGIPAGGGPAVFFASRTPGAINNASAFPGVVKDTNFDVDRGFYDTPFQLTITSATPGATIRYTLDGSPPTATSGTLYTGPISIDTTSTVRAIATFGDWLPTNVDTHTYIFINDVAQQPANPPGWPTTWGSHDGISNIPSDYEMDPRVVNDDLGLAEHTIGEALLDIPTVAISMEIDDFISDSTGIYANPQTRTERFCAIEYILPDGTEGFQENCKIEVHGNASRRPARMQKHSLRLTFSSEVGIPKLRYPLFPQSEVEEFNKLVLRACFTDSWALVSWGGSNRYRPNDSMMTRDVWMKDSHRAMGHVSGNGDYVHLYVNGLYFGVHDLTERLEDDWYASHLGGRTEDWEVNADILTPGPLWNSMISLLNGNIASNAVYEQAKDVIDIDNYIDYIFLHFYADAEDWPTKNGYAAVNAISGDGRWRFQVWDQEISLDKFTWNRYNSNRGSMIPFQRLRLNEEFRMRFADRVAKHVYNNGALTETNSVNRYLALCGELDKAIVAESARWGDVQASTPYGNTTSSSNDPFNDFYPPTINNPIYFTREQHWIVERDHVVNGHIPVILDETDNRSIIRELRQNNLYPQTDPPVFAQHGGIVPDQYELTMTAPEGIIYYTLDGSDPRVIGGGINPNAGSLTTGVLVDNFIDFEASGWRFLDNGVGQSNSDVVAGNPAYNPTDWKHPDFDDTSWNSGTAMLGFGTIGAVPINTQVNRPNPRPITYYFRKDFNVTNASQYTSLELEIIRDDGAIIYLNGKEIGRTNLAPGTVTPATTATTASPEDEIVPLSAFTLSPGDLVEGTNTIAIELHQSSANSSDIGLDFRLSGTKPNDGASSVPLTQTGPVNARVLSNGGWSALTSAEFIVGIAASPANLVVSEIHYNPPGDDSPREWIELMNISGGPIDLTDVSFIGITYTFPAGTTLDAGERIVVVRDQASFAADYDTAGIRIAPGTFTGNLNNGGEELALIDATGTTDIQRFTYDDELPWPVLADGGGASLVLISPTSNPPASDWASWRASFVLGGSPGDTDTQTFTGDPNADDDNDGLTALLEFALGSVDGDNGPSPESLPTLATGSFGEPAINDLTLTFRRNLAAEDVTISIERTTNLVDWNPVSPIVISAFPNGDGTETVTYRLQSQPDINAREFIRLKVEQTP